MQPSKEQIDNIIDIALAEDISHGDVTSEALIPPDLQGKAFIIAKEKGIVVGGEVAGRVFLKVDPPESNIKHDKQKVDQLLKVGQYI